MTIASATRVAVAAQVKMCLAENFAESNEHFTLRRKSHLAHVCFLPRGLRRAHPSHEQRSAGGRGHPALQQAQQHQVPAFLPSFPAQPRPAAAILRERYQAGAQQILVPQTSR